MAAISLMGVRLVHADGSIALRDIDLEIADGEILAVIGPSGAGKTTLLRVIAGLAHPSAGHLLIDGQDADRRSLRDRDFAYMPQGDSLMAHRTVAEQLAFPLEVRGVGRADIIARVQAEGMAMGLGRLMGRRPPQLSAGEAQRVSLGRTRTRVASALLLDEPLSRADAGERARLRADLLAYQRAGEVTMVLATNDHDEALLLADRILVLRAGRTVQVGTPEAILRQPSEEWVAGFVGDPPMGVVDATVEADSAMGWLRVADQRLRFPGGLPGPLAQRAGRPLRLGVRPHHLRPPASPDEAVDRRLRAVVGHVTPWPDHQLVQLDLPGGRWQARFPRGVDARRGTTVEVVADVRSMCAFEADGMALWHGDP